MTISECQEEIQNYAAQMSLPENSVKLDVLAFLHSQMGKYIAAWQIIKRKESAAAAATLTDTP